MVRKPIRNEVTVARIHFGVSKYSKYHRRDQVEGGNSRYWESENDMGITINVGSTRRSMINEATR
jgi:hypothetical protein